MHYQAALLNDRSCDYTDLCYGDGTCQCINKHFFKTYIHNLCVIPVNTAFHNAVLQTSIKTAVAYLQLQHIHQQTKKTFDHTVPASAKDYILFHNAQHTLCSSRK